MGRRAGGEAKVNPRGSGAVKIGGRSPGSAGNLGNVGNAAAFDT